MLEFLRSKSTGYLAWIILGAIALVFGLQFGLPSDSLTLGPDNIAKVYGETIRMEDYGLEYQLALRAGMVPKDSEERKASKVNETIIDSTIERLLMAHEAREMGLDATVDNADDLIIDGHVLMLGMRRDWLGPDQKFNLRIFNENWLRSLGVNETRYREHQRDAILTAALYDVIAASVVVPEPELRRIYDEGANKISIRYARYELATFADLVQPTDAELDAYIAEHADELDSRYDADKAEFTGLPKQARLSLVKVTSDEEARAALEQARTEIVEGTKTFEAVAGARSEHASAARGGDYGWVAEIDTSDLPEPELPPAVREAVPNLEDGVVSEIIEADGALWLLQVTARREGDVPKEQALRELALPGLQYQMAGDLARRAAEEDLDAVTSGMAIGEVFSQPGALGETTLFGGTSIEDVPLRGEGEDGAEGDADGAEGDADGAEGDADGEGSPTASTGDGDPLAGRPRPKAEMRSTGPVPRGQPIPMLDGAKGLIDDAWAYTGEAELFDRVYDVPGAVVLAGVESHSEGTDEDYAAQRRDLMARQQLNDGAAIVEAWAHRRCNEALARGDIKVSEATIKRLTAYDGEDQVEAEDPDKPAEPAHQVCSQVGGAFIRAYIASLRY